MKIRLLAVLLALSLVSAGCKKPSGSAAAPPQVRGAEQPTSQVYVLVDLSETWFNANSAELNGGVLREVGEGIAAYATNVEPPILVEYRAIGANSLFRAPLCNTLYMPTLLGGRSADTGRSTSAKKFRRYLVDHCPAYILSRAAEPLTEISATVASVTAEPRPPGADRSIVIASDFLEERPGNAQVELGDLSKTRILLVYRPLTADQMAPQDLALRVAAWKAALEAAGGQVSIAPDPSFRRSTVLAFLTKPTS